MFGIRKKVKVFKFDIINELKTKQDVIYYLETAIEEDDPDFLEKVKDDVKKAIEINHIKMIDDDFDNEKINGIILKIIEMFRTMKFLDLKLSFNG